MKLREMTTDQILDELDKRSDALLEAEMIAGKHEAKFKAFESASAVAWRDSGKSMSEAEARVRGGNDWVLMYEQLQAYNVQSAHAKRRYQAAVIASDLYRTEMATLRNIR